VVVDDRMGHKQTIVFHDELGLFFVRVESMLKAYCYYFHSIKHHISWQCASSWCAYAISL
jgi:hypothetical protein